MIASIGEIDLNLFQFTKSLKSFLVLALRLRILQNCDWLNWSVILFDSFEAMINRFKHVGKEHTFATFPYSIKALVYYMLFSRISKPP